MSAPKRKAVQNRRCTKRADQNRPTVRVIATGVVRLQVLKKRTDAVIATARGAELKISKHGADTEIEVTARPDTEPRTVVLIPRNVHVVVIGGAEVEVPLGYSLRETPVSRGEQSLTMVDLALVPAPTARRLALDDLLYCA